MVSSSTGMTIVVSAGFVASRSDDMGDGHLSFQKVVRQTARMTLSKPLSVSFSKRLEHVAQNVVLVDAKACSSPGFGLTRTRRFVGGGVAVGGRRPRLLLAE